jgi:hypothetical protein
MEHVSHPAVVANQETPMDSGSHPAVVALAATITHVANLLRLPIEAITVEYLEAKEWPDSCLGLPDENEGCADVVTPGFLIVLADGFSYRTDMQGNVRREIDTVDRELDVHFRQSGGIGGWSSEFHGDDSSLAPADAATVRQFLEVTDFFHLPEEVGNGQPIADGYSYRITVAHGRQRHTVSTYDGTGPFEHPALADFLTWLKAQAPEPGPAAVVEQAASAATQEST